MFKSIINWAFYERDSVDVYRMTKFPDGVEIDLDSFLVVTTTTTEAPVPGQWIPLKKYYLTEKDSELFINISSKYYYEAINKDSKSNFLTPNKYKINDGTLELRKKREVNWIAILSVSFSLISLFFTGLNYIDRTRESELARQEMNSAKSPVWIVKYLKDDNSLHFSSPSSDVQMQAGYVEFAKEAKSAGGRLFMPEMKLNLNEFMNISRKDMSSFPRQKDRIIFGNGKVYQTFALATTYTYKGEVLHKGAIYRLFFDTKVPSINDKDKQLEFTVRGVSFVRFVREDENLVKGLHNVNWKESTSDPEWIRLLQDGE